MQGHRNGWLPGCIAMPGHELIACGDVGETSAICCQEASRSDASLILIWWDEGGAVCDSNKIMCIHPFTTMHFCMVYFSDTYTNHAYLMGEIIQSFFYFFYMCIYMHIHIHIHVV